MKKTLIHALLFEDNPGDVRLFQELLHEEGLAQVELDHFERLKTGLEYLAQARPDVILLDLGLPDSQGLETFARVYAQAPEVPIVVLTGFNDTEQAVAAVTAGAQDYLVKGELSGGLLVRAIRYAIERKEAAEVLRRSEEQYRVLIEQAADGIFISDGTGKYVAVNSRGCAMLGYPLTELLEKNLSDLIPAEDKDQEPPRLNDLRAGKVIISERRLICKDGSLLPVEISGKMLSDGRFQGIVRDITERKRAENDLRQYSRRLAVINRLDHVISSSLDIGTVYDAFVVEMKMLVEFDYTSIIQLDDACENWQITRQWTNGNSSFQPQGWYPLNGTAVSWVMQHRQAYLEETLGEQIAWPEYAGLRSEGIQCQVLLPLVLQGKVSGMLTLASRKPKAYQQGDLDLLQTLADQLALAVQNAKLYAQVRLTAEDLEQRVQARTLELERANQDLESFSYSVSHDLRAPLRAIDGFSRIIVEDYAGKLDAEGIRLLNVVRSNTSKMDQLITALLALSRATRTELKLSRIDMAVLANSIYHEVASPEVQHKFAFSISALPDAYGDTILLRQVWANLLSNAIKYTLPKDERRIEVGSYRENEMNVYYVKDNGVGFNPVYTPKLFGVFQRLHKSEDFEGTGVGLAIVQRIIQRHGGKAWGEGALGLGATFYFSLPGKAGDNS